MLDALGVRSISWNCAPSPSTDEFGNQLRYKSRVVVDQDLAGGRPTRTER